MKKIVFKNVENKVRKIEFTKLLRYEANLSLKTSKGITDDLLDGIEREIEVHNEAKAHEIIDKACRLGILGEIVDEFD